MPGFEALYKQTVTIFNRKKVGDSVYWYPCVIPNVHLIIDKSIIISTYGEQATDNAKLHIRYTPQNEKAIIKTQSGAKEYMLPKEFRSVGNPDSNITFAYGDDFDFIMEGAYNVVGPISDEWHRNGFFNYMNRTFDNVFAITNVSRFNLIPHFEIVAR